VNSTPRLNLSLKQLQAFVWVSDLGSFRKAADRLNTTQPNISTRISSLESVLDTKLMERDAGSVRLTTKGQELLSYARKVLRATDRLVEAADRAVLFDDVMKLGVTEMIVHTWLRDFIRHFKDTYPNVTVEITVDLSINIENQLMERSIDLALQSGPITWKSSGQEKLGVYPLVWIASAKTNLPQKKEISFEQLVQYPILTHARGTQPYREVEAHFQKRRDLPARLVPSSNLAACIQMAIDGFGVATVPKSMVEKELKSGQLFQLNYPWTPKALEFFARFDIGMAPPLIVKASDIAAKVSKSFLKN